MLSVEQVRSGVRRYAWLAGGFADLAGRHGIGWVQAGHCWYEQLPQAVLNNVRENKAMQQLKIRRFGRPVLLVVAGAFAIIAGLNGCGGGSSPELTTGAAAPVVVVPPAGPTLSVISAFANAAGTITVTSTNTLAIGDVVIISGPNSFNATFTVTAATPTTFSFASATIPAVGETGFWQPAGGPVAGCTTSNPGGGGAITLARAESRVTGVAPLAVFFDASGTTHSTGTIKTFHELEYQWNFGDTNQALAPGGTTWANGSRPGSSQRNSARGPLAAHVYETPGTYVVSLTVTDGTAANTVSNNCIQIAVTDPTTVFAGLNTICVSAVGMPSAGADDCPAGAAVVLESNFATIVTNHARTGKRVLLRRGQTFTVPVAAQTRFTGPGTIGAYGLTGAAPIIQSTGASSGLLLFSGNGTPGIGDWRLMDLQFDGTGSASGTAGVASDGGINQLTLLRVAIRNVRLGLKLDYELLDFYNGGGSPGHTLYDQIAMVDSTTNNILGFASGYSVFAAASRLMLLGNNFNNNANFADPANGGEHTVRLPYVNKGVISNNIFQGYQLAKVALAIRAPVHGSGGVTSANSNDTKHVIVSDNKFVGTNAAGVVAYTPSAFEDARITEVITERNWFVAGGGTVNGTQQLLEMLGVRTHTVRNNIFDTSGGREHLGIIVGNGLNPSDTVYVYNNTFYSADADTDFFAVEVRPATAVFPTNVTVTNNLAYAPNDTSHVMISCNGSTNLALCIAANLTFATNSSNAQIGNPGTDPLLTSIAPFTPANAKPTALSYAVSNGTVVPVWSDFFLVPQTAARDLGAVIH